MTDPTCATHATGETGSTDDISNTRSRWKGKRLAIVLVAAVALVAGGWFAIDAGMKRTVPDLTGLTPVKAEILLRETGLAIEQEYVGPDMKWSLYEVHSQEPSPGSRVYSESAVAVVYHPIEVEVPDVVGMPFSEARLALEDAHLTVNHDLGDHDPDPTWKVLSQTQKAGTEVSAGSALAIRLDIPDMEVPDVAGLLVDEAKTKLERAYLKHEIKGAGNTVISTDRKPGERVSIWATVTMRAGSKMPDVVGMTGAAARNALSEAGFTSIESGDDFDLKVQAQNIPAGKVVDSSTKISLTLPKRGTIYRITGNGSSALITYAAPGTFSIQQETAASLPWEKYFENSTGTAVFNAQIQDGDSVTCTLIRNGEVVKELTSTGMYSVVQC
ncbi:MmpS family transport accessory protein [Leucobacter sp.]